MMSYRAIAVVALALVACGGDDLPDYSQLGGLRVLAIQAGPDGGTAEVGPAGGALNVSALVSDVAAGGRTLSHSAEACFDRGVSFGAEPSCDGAPERVVVATGGATNTATFGAGYTGVVGPFAVTVPAGLLVGRRDADRFNGVAYLVVFRIRDSGTGESVTAFKRLVVTERATLNSNPAVPVIQADGSPLAVLPPAKVELSSDAAAESYQVKRTDGTLADLVEKPVLTWFFSDGDFQRFRTEPGGTNSWTPPSTAPAGHDIVVVVVARDGRGGESWAVGAF